MKIKYVVLILKPDVPLCFYHTDMWLLIPEFKIYHTDMRLLIPEFQSPDFKTQISSYSLDSEI